jgi:hypothetical protein
MANDNDDDNDDLNDDNASKDDNNKVNKNMPPNMAKTAATKNTKAAASAPKKAGSKITGEEVIDIDTPPKKKQHAANWAAASQPRPSRGTRSTITPRGVKIA